jgi:hypothetical protein
MLQLGSVFVVAILVYQAKAESSGPTPCEACRLVSVELERELEQQSKLNEEQILKEGKTNPDVDRKSLDQALEQVCAKMYSYEVQTDDKTALKYRRNPDKRKSFQRNINYFYLSDKHKFDKLIEMSRYTVSVQVIESDGEIVEQSRIAT